MVKFFRYHLLRRLWFLPLIGIWTYVALTPFLRNKQLAVFTGSFEHNLFLPAFIFTIFMFSSRAEVEFCRCYGFGLTKLCLAQVGPYVIYTLLSMAAAVVLFPLQQVGATNLQRLVIFCSGALNVMFAVSVAVFARVLIRNLFGALGFELVFYYLISSGHYDARYDPLSKYFTDLSAYTGKIANGLADSTFYKNRLLALVATVLFTVGAVLLMKSKNYTEAE